MTEGRGADETTSDSADAPAKRASPASEAIAAQLTRIGERREVRFAGIRFSGRRRRPVGAKAPLPRHLRASGKFWAVHWPYDGDSVGLPLCIPRNAGLVAETRYDHQ